jgi:hypothetical protein
MIKRLDFTQDSPFSQATWSLLASSEVRAGSRASGVSRALAILVPLSVIVSPCADGVLPAGPAAALPPAPSDADPREAGPVEKLRRPRALARTPLSCVSVVLSIYIKMDKCNSGSCPGT